MADPIALAAYAKALEAGGGGGPSPSDANPQAPGTAAPGSSADYSRADHVHPQELPTVTASDYDELLTVDNTGKWVAGTRNPLSPVFALTVNGTSVTTNTPYVSILFRQERVLNFRLYQGLPGTHYRCYRITEVDADNNLLTLEAVEGTTVHKIVLGIPSGGTAQDNAVGTYSSYSLLPDVSAADNGKVARVVNGVWSAVELPSASGVNF